MSHTGIAKLPKYWCGNPPSTAHTGRAPSLSRARRPSSLAPLSLNATPAHALPSLRFALFSRRPPPCTRHLPIAYPSSFSFAPPSAAPNIPCHFTLRRNACFTVARLLARYIFTASRISISPTPHALPLLRICRLSARHRRAGGRRSLKLLERRDTFKSLCLAFVSMFLLPSAAQSPHPLHDSPPFYPRTAIIALPLEYNRRGLIKRIR